MTAGEALEIGGPLEQVLLVEISVKELLCKPDLGSSD